MPEPKDISRKDAKPQRKRKKVFLGALCDFA
jgi:hypothetical protein